MVWTFLFQNEQQRNWVTSMSAHMYLQPKLNSMPSCHQVWVRALCGQVCSHSPCCTLLRSYPVVLARRQGREKPKSVWFIRLHTPLVMGTLENQSWAPCYTHYPNTWSQNNRVRLAPSWLSQKEEVGIDHLEHPLQMNGLLSKFAAEMNQFNWFLTEGLE